MTKNIYSFHNDNVYIHLMILDACLCIQEQTHWSNTWTSLAMLRYWNKKRFLLLVKWLALDI